VSCNTRQKKLAVRCAVKNGVGRAASLTGAIVGETALRAVGTVGAVAVFNRLGGDSWGRAVGNALGPGLGAAAGGAVGNQVGGPGGALAGQVIGGLAGWGYRGQARRAATRPVISAIRAERQVSLARTAVNRAVRAGRNSTERAAIRQAAAGAVSAALTQNQGRGGITIEQAINRAAQRAGQQVILKQRLPELRRQRRQKMFDQAVSEALKVGRRGNPAAQGVLERVVREAGDRALKQSDGQAGNKVARVVRQATHAAALKAAESRNKDPDRIAAMALKAAERAIGKSLIAPKKQRGGGGK
jgi:hypothetical protein